ncbi:MAG: DUF2809 domain-containing protein [Clostridia bacterium]|nr:DUF2809 domain-containing protein [Clostridia bacterium]
MKKIRLKYLAAFLVLLAGEIIIALYVHDSFVRPYMGDMLVVAVICAFLRIFVPQKIKYLPIFTAAFAVLVEVLQYFDFVSLLGLADSRFFSILLGRTFDIKDIFCYIIGGLLFFAAEKTIRGDSE